MTKQDFMSIEAVRSPEIQKLFSDAIDGKLTKSAFVELYCQLPHVGRNARKQHKAKQGVFQADRIESLFGWTWHEPEPKNDWQKETARWLEKARLNA